MPNTDPNLVYKITTAAIWQKARADGVVAPMPVDIADGYMHFSTAGQLRETLARHFAGQSALMLLAVRTADVVENLKWEVSRGGALFPHLYASLGVNSVAWAEPLAVAADGSVELPEGVK